MVAPAGVSEGTPREPAKAGVAPAGLAEVDPAKAVPAQGMAAEALPAQGVAAEEAVAEAVPAAAAAGEVPTAAGAAVGELAQAGVEPAATEPAEVEAAGTGPAEAEAAGTGPAEADEPGWDAAERGRNISVLAVMGIIVGIIALVGAAVAVLAMITHGFRPKTVITYRPAAVFGLRPGECVNIGANALSATVLSCAAPHDAEVFATFALPAAAWPGAAAEQQEAGNGCESRLGSYLNPQLATADLTQEYVYPNQAAWKAGERTVVCEVSAVSGKLTGSVRAKG
jgi:Septum formation